MIGTMIQTAGERVLRSPNQDRKGAGYIHGDFYKLPQVGKPFRMWASNGTQMRMVETSSVVKITHNNMRFVRFQVKDGAEFELKDIEQGGTAIMVNGGVEL